MAVFCVFIFVSKLFARFYFVLFLADYCRRLRMGKLASVLGALAEARAENSRALCGARYCLLGKCPFLCWPFWLVLVHALHFACLC